MHRQEIRMASIKMVIKTSPQNIVRKSCTSSWLFYIKIQEFYAFFRVHRCMDTIHFSLSHTKQSSVRTEDSSVYILFICFSKYLESVVKVRPSLFVMVGFSWLPTLFVKRVGMICIVGLAMVVNADLINSRLTQTRYSIFSGNCRWNTNLQWHGY